MGQVSEENRCAFRSLREGWLFPGCSKGGMGPSNEAGERGWGTQASQTHCEGHQWDWSTSGYSQGPAPCPVSVPSQRSRPPGLHPEHAWTLLLARTHTASFKCGLYCECTGSGWGDWWPSGTRAQGYCAEGRGKAPPSTLTPSQAFIYSGEVHGQAPY